MNCVWIIFRYSLCTKEGDTEYTVIDQEGVPRVERWSHILYDINKQMEIILSSKIKVSLITPDGYRILEEIDLLTSEIKIVRKEREVAVKVLQNGVERRFQVSFTSELDSSEFNAKYVELAKSLWKRKREKRMKKDFLKNLKRLNKQ